MASTTAAEKRSSAAKEPFASLKKILQPFAKRTVAVADTPTCYQLALRDVTFRKRPVWFAGVRAGKAYTSFHLMPLYVCEPMQRRVSPELKRRMQGKTCFNFKAVDEKLFAELAALTQAGFEQFAKTDWAALEQSLKKKKK